MPKDPAGMKPAPRKKPTRKPATPAKKVAGSAAPASKQRAQTPAKKRPAPKKESAKEAPQLGLTAKQQRFVDEYLIDLNATQAAVRAGYSPDTARQMGAENLSKPYIQLALAEARKAQQARTQISADAVLLQAWMIATADARELTEVRVGCCRHCWGEGFKYQRTVAEFNKDRERFMLDQRMKRLPPDDEFDEKGGIGYDPLKAPHPACAECRGDGYARDVLKDTRYLSPAAAQLFAGVKRTKDGVQVLTHSKEAFAEKLWKHLGLYQKDNEQKVDPLTALLHRIAGGNANGFPPVQHDPEAPPTGAGSNSIGPRAQVSDDD